MHLLADIVIESDLAILEPLQPILPVGDGDDDRMAAIAGRIDDDSLGAGMRYQGESWADRLNTLKVPGATVFDAAVRYKKDNWEAALNVTNLFDKEYVRGCQGDSTCGYGDARTITFKLSKVW